MSNIAELIRQAKLTCQALETAYQAADINAKLTMQSELAQAKTKLVDLQTANLRNRVTITDDDIAQMRALRDKINDAAQLQTALSGIISLVGKFLA